MNDKCRRTATDVNAVDGCPRVEGSAPGRSDAATRRRFVGGTLVATAAAVAGHLIAPRHARKPTPTPTPTYPPELYAGENRRFFHEIQVDENTHAQFLGPRWGRRPSRGRRSRTSRRRTSSSSSRCRSRSRTPGPRPIPPPPPSSTTRATSRWPRGSAGSRRITRDTSTRWPTATLVPDDTPFLFLQPLHPRAIVGGHQPVHRQPQRRPDAHLPGRRPVGPPTTSRSSTSPWCWRSSSRSSTTSTCRSSSPDPAHRPCLGPASSA